MALAGAQGYGNALSQAQLSATSSTNGSMLSLVGSSNQYAIGQGTAAAMNATQAWWNERVQNSFDYIFGLWINGR